MWLGSTAWLRGSVIHLWTAMKRPRDPRRGRPTFAPGFALAVALSFTRTKGVPSRENASHAKLSPQSLLRALYVYV